MQLLALLADSLVEAQEQTTNVGLSNVGHSGHPSASSQWPPVVAGHGHLASVCGLNSGRDLLHMFPTLVHPHVVVTRCTVHARLCGPIGAFKPLSKIRGNEVALVTTLYLYTTERMPNLLRS